MIKIRKCLSEKEISDIELIEKEVFKENEQYTKDFIKLLCEYCKDLTYILYLNDEPIGYISGCLEFRKVGHIISIAIRKNYQGKGFGKLLMCILLRKFLELNVERVVLEVKVTNLRAIEFYKKFNFKEMYILPHYYPNGENAYVMYLTRSELEKIVQEKCSLLSTS